MYNPLWAVLDVGSDLLMLILPDAVKTIYGALRRPQLRIVISLPT